MPNHLASLCFQVTCFLMFWHNAYWQSTQWNIAWCSPLWLPQVCNLIVPSVHKNRGAILCTCTHTQVYFFVCGKLLAHFYMSTVNLGTNYTKQERLQIKFLRKLFYFNQVSIRSCENWEWNMTITRGSWMVGETILEFSVWGDHWKEAQSDTTLITTGISWAGKLFEQVFNFKRLTSNNDLSKHGASVFSLSLPSLKSFTSN